MSKKIQISTVQKQANVEVIDLNSYFIAKAVKAQLVAHNAIDPMVCEATRPITESNGEVKKDEHGDAMFETVKFIERNNQITPEALQTILDDVIPFLDELVKAFEE